MVMSNPLQAADAGADVSLHRSHTLRGPHADGDCEDQTQLARRGAANGVEPPDDASPADCDAAGARAVYRTLMKTAIPEIRKRAEAGDEDAGLWLGQFMALGERLGVRRADPELHRARRAESGALVRRIDNLLARRRIPSAAYRIQFSPAFTFHDALQLVPYLEALGVSDCYVSPVTQARAGSGHGYDVCDHGRLNPELGGEAAFGAFADALRRRGMGLILDIVPNHMGILETHNAWWMDVLENGPSSPYASFFDIDWRPVNPDLENKVLLPLLEDQYGRVLEAGKIRLAYADGGFFVRYYEIKLPVAPCTYPVVLQHALAGLAEAPGEGNERLRELRSILTALQYLPARTETSPARVAERGREKEVVKRRLAALCDAGPEVRAALCASVRVFNGEAGDPRSFDLLGGLIDRQPYRLAYWRVAAEEINYRRFFDINELAAIRMEIPEVFRSTHRLIFQLLAEGKATGLRIDHPDGLRDPAGYFRQLQENYVLARIRAELPPGDEPQGLEQEAAARFEVRRGEGAASAHSPPLYVVAEKILAEGEHLPPDWEVNGTTGYDFLNAVNGLFVDGRNRDAFDRIYRGFAGPAAEYDQLVNSAKKMIMLTSMPSEINALAHQLDRIAERNRRCRDFTLNGLTFALREVIACLPVYRTYLTGPGGVSLRDQLFIEAAVEEAKRRNPRTAESVFDFVADALLLRTLDDFPEADRPSLVEWALKVQQLTGPVMAKGVEDTVFYTYNRLLSLNEVGGSPDRFGVSVGDFHRRNQERLAWWPHSLLTTSTHDTKRGEDMRARLNVLSEIPGEWEAALTRWARWNAGKKPLVEGRPAPDSNAEYLLYQTLLGAWPSGAQAPDDSARFRRRVADYMRKATKEAKAHTSWVNPNEEYDDAVQAFTARVLDDSAANPFLDDFQAFQRRVAYFGCFNSLAQVLLKLTCVGVPDIYQGAELWDFSLVDPDNRRPVDFRLRRGLLADLGSRIGGAVQDLRPLARELLAHISDGTIKAYLIHRVLTLRRAQPELFGHGSYQPLEAAGATCGRVVAFGRQLDDDAVLVAVPRLVVGLLGGVERPPLGWQVWGDGRLKLPPPLTDRDYRNLLTGEVLTAGPGGDSLALAHVFGQFPAAVLVAGRRDASSDSAPPVVPIAALST
jgi:(1->4)-alpha-D-glucan 1-alpha-D-glucosylmutase